MEFFATCGTGLERVLGDELRRIGVSRVRPLSGGVSFGAMLEDAYRTLLWSRVASRVLLTLARLDGTDGDALYSGVLGLPWEDHLGPGKTIAVSAHGANKALRDSRYTAQLVKDAIVDRMREKTGARPDVDAADPDVLVNVSLGRDHAIVSIDLSGKDSLEDRGYRAPGRPHETRRIHENLAAALVLAVGWGKPSLGTADLVDPLCGDGTVAIEAALIARDVAPGIARSRWGFKGWSGHDEQLWENLLDEADRREDEGRGAPPRIIAVEGDPASLDYAKACARRAAVSDAIEFETDLQTAASALESAPDTVLACILPMAQDSPSARLPLLYGELAFFAARARVAGLVSDDTAFGAFLGMDATRAYQVNNGPSEASLLVYEKSAAPDCPLVCISVRDREIPVCDAAAQQFASRLNKVAKERRKWAKKKGVSAYRVYDADLPDYNLAIDLYRGAGPCEGRSLVHVAEYAPPRQIDPARASRRLADALRIIPAVLEVGPESIYVKRRVRSKGGSQYSGAGGRGLGRAKGHGRRFVTAENGLLFEVDLEDYLDTGLFLDHRDTRALLRTLAKGRSFLNLFSYTGTASVAAAAGGAKFTTTVDLSNTYLEWARANMELNGLLDSHQEFVRADVLSWVNEMRHGKNRWDLVFCDPPTFSNSAKMGGRAWDVQRDHAELLIDVSRVLTRRGVAVFSCNLRKFRLDEATLEKAGIQVVDITAKTIPHDFERNARVHHCYLLRRA